MKPRALFIIFSLALAIMVPSAFSNRQKDYPLITEVKNGTKTITNPEYPREGRFVARLTEEMACGQGGAKGEATLNTVYDMKVDDLGFVFVMDIGDNRIKIYDGGGRFVRSIGRKGQGPGEFMTLTAFNLLSGGRVCIVDSSQRRVICLTAEGRYISMFLLDGFFNAVGVDGQDRLYLAKWGFIGEPALSTGFREVPYVTSIYRTDISGNARFHLADFFGESWWIKSHGKTGSMGSGGVYVIVWNVSRQGRLYGGINEDYRLGAYGAGGAFEFSFGRLFKPVKNAQFKGPFAQKKHLPVFSNSRQTISFDGDGNLWIELFQDNDRDGFLYDIFSPEGVYLKQVKVERQVYQIKNGKVYSLVQTEDGYPEIKRFRMDLAPEGR